MYCKTCGYNNPDTANYCVNDGALLSQMKHKYKSSGQAQYCPDCGEQSSLNQTYCGSCGQTLVKYAKDKGVPIPILPKVESESLRSVVTSIKVPKFSITYLKNAFIPVIVTFVILFISAFAILSSVEETMNTMITEQLGEMDITYMLDMIEDELGEDVPRFDKIIGITDIVMLSNMQDSTFTFNLKGLMDGDEGKAEGTLDLQNSSVIYLLITFIALFIGGAIMGIRNKGSEISRLSSTIYFAVSYGVILALVSLFSGFSYKNRISDGEYMDLTISLANNYSFIDALLRGFILAFIFARLGLLFTFNYRKITGNLREFTLFGEALHQAFSTIVRGGLLLFAVIFVTLYSKVEEVKEGLLELTYYLPISIEELLDKSYIFVSVLSVQLSNYVWNLLHFTPLTFIARGDGELGKVTFSTFSGFDSKGAATELDFVIVEYFLSESNIDLYLKLAIIIPIALFVWSGYQIAKSSNQVISNVLVFSIAYAVLIGLLASFSDIGFEMKFEATGEMTEATTMNLGFPVIRLFISSLILSFVCAYGGTWLRKLKA